MSCLIVFGDRPARRRRHHGVLIVGEMKDQDLSRNDVLHSYATEGVLVSVNAAVFGSYM